MAVEEQENSTEELEDPKKKKRKPFEEHAIKLPPATGLPIGEPMLLDKKEKGPKESDENAGNNSEGELIRKVRKQIPQRTRPINRPIRRAPPRRSPPRHPGSPFNKKRPDHRR